MAQHKLTNKLATATTPQVVTLVVDDSGSMKGAKASEVTQAMTDLVITMQSVNLGSSGARFFLNISKFGTATTAIAEAARPDSISLAQIAFSGTSGNTEMAVALNWAVQAVQKGLEECRRAPGYLGDDKSPNPLVIFFSDGANTGGDVTPSAQALRSIPFGGGNVDVVAVGIGMDQKDFPIMERIASRPELAVNIDPSDLSNFIASVGATAIKGEGAEDLVAKFD